MRIHLLELLIDALEWTRCRIHGWIGQAYLWRDRIALRKAERKAL